MSECDSCHQPYDLTDDYNFEVERRHELKKERDNLRAKLEIAVKALEIYAKPPMWVAITDKENDCSPLGIKHLSVEYEPFKIAQQALAGIAKITSQGVEVKHE